MILFRLTNLQAGEFFELAPLASIGDTSISYVRNIFPHALDLASLVSALLTCGTLVWNSLPESVDFRSLASFIRTVTVVDLPDHLIILGE